ncbi:MAG: Bug family tripartite tricarboxylate transporter substrate binding protein [Burkholderiales bacterium]
MQRINTIRAGALFAISLVFSHGLFAQSYPVREIRSICQSAPGSGADILIRHYSGELSKRLGQPVIVENMPGAQGKIASMAAARAKPDGYTIYITPASASLAAAPHIFKEMGYDPVKDFTPVATIVQHGVAIAVSPKSPVTSMRELTALLKTKTGHGNFGSSSNTSIAAGELYKELAGLQTTTVKYKDANTLLLDMLRGDLDWMSSDIVFLSSRASSVRILALTSAVRSPWLPDVPTMAESGLNGMDVPSWWGVVVPAGTPRPIVDRLGVLFNEITVSDDTKKFLQKLAIDPMPGSAETMISMLKRDTERWGRLAQLAKIERE